MKVELKGENLVITIPVQKTPTLSSSGKTLVVATSHGNKGTGVMINGKEVILGLNAYVYVKER